MTALSQQLGLSFGALYATGEPRGEVETFVSRQGHVTDWHFDFMENFTLQLSGTKVWRLKGSAVGVPSRGCTPMWGRADHAVRSAAEQQAMLHAQHAQTPARTHALRPSSGPGWAAVVRGMTTSVAGRDGLR